MGQENEVPAGDTSPRIDAEESRRALEEMLLFMVRALADHPEDVRVEFVPEDGESVFEVRVNDADLGLLIGKKGQTARALESILNSNRRRTGRHYHLDIVGTGEADAK